MAVRLVPAPPLVAEKSGLVKSMVLVSQISAFVRQVKPLTNSK
jgi:hypothetical protein